MTTPKKSFILHNDSLDVLEELSDEQRGQLFYAIKKFQKGEEIKLSPILRIAFSPFKNQFIRDQKKYDEFCEQQQLKGKKGGRPPKPKVTQITQRVIKKPKKAYNDNDNDNDSKNDSENKKDSNSTLPSVETTSKKGNVEVNLFLADVKKETQVPPVAGAKSRQYAWNFLRALKKEYPDQNPNDLARKIIQIAVGLNDGWHSTKAHDPKHLFYNWQEIIQKTKPKTSSNKVAICPTN